MRSTAALELPLLPLSESLAASSDRRMDSESDDMLPITTSRLSYSACSPPQRICARRDAAADTLPRRLSRFCCSLALRALISPRLCIVPTAKEDAFTNSRLVRACEPAERIIYCWSASMMVGAVRFTTSLSWPSRIYLLWRLWWLACVCTKLLSA